MTARIGDFLPEKDRRESAARQLTAGRVLYLNCDFTNPPKDKYVVVAAPEDPPVLLIVNSKIAEFIKATPDLRKCQVTLQATDHSFLNHDSHLDCSKAFDSMSREEIIKQLAADFSRIKGELTVAARGQVLEVVRGAKTISDAHRRRVVAALT